MEIYSRGLSKRDTQEFLHKAGSLAVYSCTIELDRQSTCSHNERRAKDIGY